MLETYIKTWIEKWVELLLKEAEKNTPEDTYKLQEGNKKQPIRQQGDIISWWLINETEYAPYVEYGVSGKKYNYYKWGGRRAGWSPFYSWVGARMYSKAQFENEKEVKSIIEGEINKFIRQLNK